MPTEDLTRHFTVASRKKRARAEKMGLPMPKAEWGEFNKLRACHAIRRHLRSHAQHLALVLALLTPEDGVIEITHKDLHECTGRAGETIAMALKECESAGFLFGKRTLGTFVYVWGEPAFRGISAQERRTSFLGASAPTFLDERAPTKEELGIATIHAYRMAWIARYQMDKHDVEISAAGLERIVSRIEYLALHRNAACQTFGAAYTRTAGDFFTAWLARNGQGESKWLAERFHPLQSLADGSGRSPDADLDWTTKAVLDADRKNAERSARRERATQDESAHVPGQRPRVALDAKNPFARLVPRSVQAEMGVAS